MNVGELRSSKILKILIIICVTILIVGPITIIQLIQLRDDVPQIETQYHPLTQVPPPIELPESDIEWIYIDNLSLRIYWWVYTYLYHNGSKGTAGSLHISVSNDSNTTIEDLCFWRMTVYWADGSANFTTGFTDSTNFTLEAGSWLSNYVFEYAHDWTGIPEELCLSSRQVYGRILMSYNSTISRVVTTPLIDLANLIE